MDLRDKKREYKNYKNKEQCTHYHGFDSFFKEIIL